MQKGVLGGKSTKVSVYVLPIALVRIWITACVMKGVSPFEILYGRLYPIVIVVIKGD